MSDMCASFKIITICERGAIWKRDEISFTAQITFKCFNRTDGDNRLFYRMTWPTCWIAYEIDHNGEMLSTLRNAEMQHGHVLWRNENIARFLVAAVRPIALYDWIRVVGLAREQVSIDLPPVCHLRQSDNRKKPWNCGTKAADAPDKFTAFKNNANSLNVLVHLQLVCYNVVMSKSSVGGWKVANNQKLHNACLYNVFTLTAPFV